MYVRFSGEIVLSARACAASVGGFFHDAERPSSVIGTIVKKIRRPDGDRCVCVCWSEAKKNGIPLKRPLMLVLRVCVHKGA